MVVEVFSALKAHTVWNGNGGTQSRENEEKCINSKKKKDNFFLIIIEKNAI